MTQSKSKDKEKENENSGSCNENLDGFRYSPFKSEFKTSEEITHELLRLDKKVARLWNKSVLNRKEKRIEDIKREKDKKEYANKLWFSKEDYEKRVEEFKQEIMNIGITKSTAPIVFDLINKILLDKK